MQYGQTLIPILWQSSVIPILLQSLVQEEDGMLDSNSMKFRDFGDLSWFPMILSLQSFDNS